MTRDPEIRVLLKDLRKQSDVIAERDAYRRGGGGGDGLGEKSMASSPLPRANAKATKGGAADSSPGTLSNMNFARQQTATRCFKREDSKMSMHSGSDEADAKRKGICERLFGPVLHPDGKFRVMWNVCLAFFIVYCGITVPLEIAFDEDMTEQMCGRGGGQIRLQRAECGPYLAWFWGNFVIDMWFISDMVVNFRTGFMAEGHFVSDDTLAAIHYLKGSFWFDLLGSFPLNAVLMLVDPSNIYNDQLLNESDDPSVGRVNKILRLLRMAKLAKLARMAKLAKYLENFEEFFNPGMMAVVKLICMLILCCHWFGCLWWLVSDLELSQDFEPSPWYGGHNNWQTPIWLKDADNFEIKYSHSFFWGAGMVTAMVPRDIEPVTTLEATITVITMFVGAIMNAYVISSLTTALQSMNSKRELAGKKLESIRSFLLLKSVPADLRSRVLEYYEYLYTSSAELATSLDYTKLPANLSTQLAIQINKRLAARCAFFREVSDACVVSLISELQPLVFVPGQPIVFEGHPLVSVYFINRGLIQLLERTQAIATLRDNENFGLDEFMMSCITSAAPVWRYSAKAVGYCDAMVLGLDRLQEAVFNDEVFKARLENGDLGTSEGGGVRQRRLMTKLRGGRSRANTSKIPDSMRRQVASMAGTTTPPVQSQRNEPPEAGDDLKA